jgi:hypothetical protein
MRRIFLVRKRPLLAESRPTSLDQFNPALTGCKRPKADIELWALWSMLDDE